MPHSPFAERHPWAPIVDATTITRVVSRQPKTSLVLPLVAAAALALVTWLVYVPAARRGA
jgi:hypothetical protein